MNLENQLLSTKKEIIQKSEEIINLAKYNISKFYEEYDKIKMNNNEIDYDFLSMLIKKYGFPVDNQRIIRRVNDMLKEYK